MSSSRHQKISVSFVYFLHKQLSHYQIPKTAIPCLLDYRLLQLALFLIAVSEGQVHFHHAHLQDKFLAQFSRCLI